MLTTGIDSPTILDQAIEAARIFRPMSEPQIASLLERTATAAADGRHELSKTSTHSPANPITLDSISIQICVRRNNLPINRGAELR